MCSNLLLFFISHLTFHAFIAQATTFIYATCSSDKFQPTSSFERNLNSLFTSITSTSSASPFERFSIGNSTEGSLYGLYQCRGDTTTTKCYNCITSAANQMDILCPYSYGAAIQLDSCYVRYEHSDFLGRLDTRLLYKKCSVTNIEEGDFFRRRDEVLANLVADDGPGRFRVTGSGLVHGYFQCTGDLSGGDCATCVREAVGKLSSLCASAAAAEVFLVKCFSRYWVDGHYDDLHSGSPSGDEAGKTVAIVVGIIGGVAILVILLSLCCKAAAR